MLSERSQTCDRVAVLNKGKLRKESCSLSCEKYKDKRNLFVCLIVLLLIRDVNVCLIYMVLRVSRNAGRI